MSNEAEEDAAVFWRRKHSEAVRLADEYIVSLEMEIERLVRLRKEDSWLESALLQLLHENGIEPSSYTLMKAFDRSKGIIYE
jgi:hypothetical protein